MKILRFNDDRIGVLRGEGSVIDISDLISHRQERGSQRSMEELIENFETYRPEIDRLSGNGKGRPLSEVRLLAPIPRPSRCLAAFVNYLDKPGRTIEQLPNEFFHKSPDLIGPEGSAVLMDLPDVVVFHAEAELAFVIGKSCKDVAEADAMDCVFGYVPFFDVSARGLTRRSQFVPKGQDTFSLCGPWITTSDEVPDPHALRVRSWLDGAPRQDYSSSDMAHRIPDQIAWLTRFQRLHAGDVIATGTHHAGLDPINSGETLEIEIERLGRARFRIEGNSPRKDVPFVAGQNLPPPRGLPITPV